MAVSPTTGWMQLHRMLSFANSAASPRVAFTSSAYHSRLEHTTYSCHSSLGRCVPHNIWARAWSTDAAQVDEQARSFVLSPVRHADFGAEVQWLDVNPPHAIDLFFGEFNAGSSFVDDLVNRQYFLSICE